MFIQPRQMIKELSISGKCTILDIGSGSGYYLLEACRLAGIHSNYIAVDSNKELLKRLKDTAIIGGYIINTLVQDLENPIILHNYVADYIILTNTLHLIKNKKQLISECRRLLAPKGLLLFVDWIENNPINNTKDNDILHSQTLASFYANDFVVKKELPAGQYHYAYILQRD